MIWMVVKALLACLGSDPRHERIIVMYGMPLRSHRSSCGHCL